MILFLNKMGSSFYLSRYTADRLRRDPEGITGDFSGNQEDYDEKHPLSNFLWL